MTARLRPKPIASSRIPLVPLGAWDRALRRDGCGAWCIHVKTGSIHAWGGDLQVGAALDAHEVTVVVLLGHAGRRGRGMPQVARAADQERPSAGRVGRGSALCHLPTRASAIKGLGCRWWLFNYFIGASNKRWWHREPKCLSRVQVDHQLELYRLDDGQLGRPLSSENPTGVDAGLAIGIK